MTSSESEIIAGVDSQSLLILASLSLDKTLDRYEVEKYLSIYLKEKNVQQPSADYSALVWLRLQIQLIISASRAQEIERRLSVLKHYYLDVEPSAVIRIANILSNLY